MLGERLRLARETKELTQQELGTKLKVSDATINRYEKGIRKPDPDMLTALAGILEVSIDWLLGRIDEPHGHRQTTEAAHRVDGYEDELSEEAKRELEAYKDYLRHKYRKG